jgi:hypothetical protein
LWFNKDIRIILADKGTCTVVLVESEYKVNLNTLLESGVHEPLPKDPTARVEKMCKNSFPNTELLFCQSKTKTDSIPEQTFL